MRSNRPSRLSLTRSARLQEAGDERYADQREQHGGDLLRDLRVQQMPGVFADRHGDRRHRPERGGRGAETSTGCLACAAKPAVAICVRSPHSAMNTTMNDIVNALAKPSCPPSLPASGSSSFLRHMTIAETKNSTPEPMCTARDGSRDSKLPAMTATRLWMASAAAAPASTGSARCRVASTSDAKAVLSGSSATKMTAKIERNRRAAAMARQYGAISPHAPKQTGPVDRGGAGRRSLDHARDAAHWSDAAYARADCDV